jgi:hypothetical protein
MKVIEKTTTKPALSWNERGRIGCAEPGHAPLEGSDAWTRERWLGITPRLEAGVKLVLGRAPKCDACAAIVPK